MGIDGVEFEPTEAQEETESHAETIALEEMKQEFSNPIVLSSKEDIAATFERMKDEPEICISIPVITRDDTDWRKELINICSELRREIFKYFGLSGGSEIERNMKFPLGEIIANLGKHSFPNEEIDKISVKARKGDRFLSLQLLNPTKPEVDLETVDPAVNFDRSSEIKEHGRSMTKDFLNGLEEDLTREDCPPALDRSFYVENQDKKKVGILEKFEAILPEKK